MVNLFEEIRTNKRKSAFVLLIFFIFSGVIFGAAAYGVTYLFAKNDLKFFIIIYGICVLAVILYIMYFLKQGDKMILKITGAKLVSRKDYPHLYHTTEALSLAAGMKVPPKCYVIEDSALNAFATGFREENSYVVVTTGLIKKLNRQEIEGVLAHEISHIKNQDIKIMLYIAGLTGVFALLGTYFYYALFFSSSRDGGREKILYLGLWILFSFIAVFFAMLFKFEISRKREYLADASGAKLTRYPEGLASALEKIKGDPDPLVDKANKATAHLFISTPFRRKKKPGFFSNLFSTHPPIDERIARLRGQKLK